MVAQAARNLVDSTPDNGPTLGRYVRTLAHLKPAQIYYLARSRLGMTRPRDLRTAPLTRQDLAPVPIIAAATLTDSGSSIRLLNLDQPLPRTEADWRAPNMTRLWRYNLHTFDVLKDPTLTTDTARRLIASWIESNPAGTPDAWDSYPISLRIVNWIKWLLANGGMPYPTIIDSLHAQAGWLHANVERHLGANHVLKNAVALIYAGLYFTDPPARRWRDAGTDLFTTALDEQFLGDGGHYERSPMYHAISTLDLIDVFGLIHQPGLGIDDRLIEATRETALRALRFLDDLTLPDGEIPLFNDAAFGVAPKPAAILDLGTRVVGYQRPERWPTEIVSMRHSGFFGVRHRDDMIVMACGPMGPDHQPGHAHCHLLSYELVHDGRRIVVDSGVYDYETGPMRHHLRGTAAHNTIKVDDRDQSEIWGAFRLGRRARPLKADITRQSPAGVVIRGAHDGYRFITAGLIHERQIQVTGNETIFLDRLTGATGRHQVESYVHLHPDLRIAREQDGWTVRDGSGAIVARLFAHGFDKETTATGLYCPEFGNAQTNMVLVLSARADLPAEFGYRIEKGPT